MGLFTQLEFFMMIKSVTIGAFKSKTEICASIWLKNSMIPAKMDKKRTSLRFQLMENHISIQHKGNFILVNTQQLKKKQKNICLRSVQT